MKQIWETLSNIGLQDHLDILEQRKIRILNQTSLNMILCCFVVILFYKILGYPSFEGIFVTMIVLASIPILFNYCYRYHAAKTAFILSFIFIELFVAYCFGEVSCVEFYVLLLPISAILLFSEDGLKMNIFFCTLGIGGFLVCEWIYFYITPIIVLPNPFFYKAVSGTTLSLMMFQNIRFFKINLLQISRLNLKQNKNLQEKQIQISKQNAVLKQVNQRLLAEIECTEKAEQQLLAVNQEL